MTYPDGTTAELALDDRRLVWRVTYESDSVYDAFVDARSGLVRRMVDLVKSDAPAKVWENYPGAPLGGGAAVIDLEPWLTASTGVLSGPNAHAYSDPTTTTSRRSRRRSCARSPTTSTRASPPSTWAARSPSRARGTTAPNSWTANRRQSAVQAFYFANRFHDHLASLGFAGFEGADPVLVEVHNGAGRGLVNNASMYTPPEGRSPRMELRMFGSTRFRAMNAADDASVVYHEYTHGLSNRLVTDAGGRGALNSPQAGAMGEGWSDYYAKDFIVEQFPGLDTATPGEVDMGTYTDNVAHTIRSQALDCPVGAAPAACPAAGSAGSGGFTYGDFGKIAGEPEVHADGEIWAQTLWDLRAAVGIPAARRLITDGMRLSPPEPTFLDMRNAILLADQAAGGGLRETIWAVFAQRGMGYFATAEPLQDFSTPPGPGVPRGTITGVVTDVASGRAIAGATAAIGSLANGPDQIVGTSGADGVYSLGGVPSRTYPNVVVTAPGYDRAVLEVTVPTGSAVRVDVALKRNWASRSGGARALAEQGSDEFADQGCGPEAAIDELQSTAWSTVASASGKSMVVALPQPVDVTDLALDPGEGCGDDANAATRAFRVETSTQGTNGPWTPAVAGTFGYSERHALSPFAAAAPGVRAVRLTLLSNQRGDIGFFDFSELIVHGSPTAPPPTAPPAPSPASPGPSPAPPAAPRAPSFTLPASGTRTVRFKVRCAVACRCPARLTVDRRTARRLGLGRRLTVVSLSRRAKAGTTTLYAAAAEQGAQAALLPRAAEGDRDLRGGQGRLALAAAHRCDPRGRGRAEAGPRA